MRVGSQRQPAAQPGPCGVQAGSPTQPPAAHAPVATASPGYFCCCAHSIKENIETERLTRQSPRGSQKPGPGAGKPPATEGPGPGPARAQSSLRGRGIAGRVQGERPSLWASEKLLSEHPLPTASRPVRTRCFIFKARIRPNESSRACVALRSLGVHTLPLLRLDPVPPGLVTLFNSFLKPRHSPLNTGGPGAPLRF